MSDSTAIAPGRATLDALEKLGWTFRPRYKDHDSKQPIIGVRLTNCRKIFDTAQTIQIFDTATVTIQFGFLQEQSVSLTREDGALFVEFLTREHPELAAPLLAIVPEGDRSPGPSSAGLDTGKSDLIRYLAESAPERFGRNGSATRPGADFYHELLALIRDPDKDELHRTQLILMAENLAHDLYADCNSTLRAARNALDPEQSRIFTFMAHGHAVAAQSLRGQALAMRNHLPTDRRPPEAEFPEEVSPDSILKEHLRDRIEARKPQNARTLLNASHIEAGQLVAVVDPLHPNYRQMGMIDSLTEDGATIWVRLAGHATAEVFKPAQLTYMSR